VSFVDWNASGTLDPGEGMAGFEIQLTSAGNPVPVIVITDANGFYSFPGLSDGSYTVCEIQQSAYPLTVPAGASACSSGGLGFTFSVAFGFGFQIDFGHLAPAL
jgi:hypothetical protein